MKILIFISLKLLNNGFQYQYSKNCLQRNNGNGSSFSEIGLIKLVFLQQTGAGVRCLLISIMMGIKICLFQVVL